MTTPTTEKVEDSSNLQEKFHPEHFADLKKSGLSDEIILASGVYSVTPRDIPKILGFNPQEVTSALAFPYHGSDFTRLKVFPAYEDNAGHKIKYLQKKGSGVHLYIPPGIDDRLADESVPLYITEGEKKTLRGSQAGLTCVGIGGIWNWKASSNNNLIPDIENLPLVHREVFIIPDSDFLQNKNILSAVYQLGLALEKKSALVKVVCLPLGESDSKTGLDDFFVSQTAADFESLPRIDLNNKIFKAVNQKNSGSSEPWFVNNQFHPQALAQEVLKLDTFLATPIDVKGKAVRLLVYENGVFMAGESRARTLIHNLLGIKSSPHRIEQTIEILQEETKIDDSKLNPQAMDLINVRNGMLDWRNGKLKPHSPVYLSTFQINAEYNSNSRSYIVDKFLEDVFPSDALNLVEELLGYILLPTTKYQVAFMLLGKGKNGKSTFLKLVAALLGKDNVSHVALHNFSENRFAVAELSGKLLNDYHDLPSKALENSDIFKAIVSGDTVQVERKFGHPFNLKTYARLIFSCNELPRSDDNTYAFFRRWKVVPFFKSFEGKVEDKNILDKLTTPEALSALLSHAINGLRRLESNLSFTDCDSVRLATEHYRVVCDQVYEFAQEKLVARKGATLKRAEVFSAYELWAAESGTTPLKIRNFNKRLSEIMGCSEGRIRVDGAQPHVWFDIDWKDSFPIELEKPGNRDNMPGIVPAVPDVPGTSYSWNLLDPEVEREAGGIKNKRNGEIQAQSAQPGTEAAKIWETTI